GVHADRVSHSVARHPWPRFLRRGPRGDRRQGQRAEMAASLAGRGQRRRGRAALRAAPRRRMAAATGSLMTDQHAVPHEPVRNLEPVHAGARETHDTRWTGRLVVFLRVMAVLSLTKGLYHWAVVCGFGGPIDGFEYQPTPWQTATVFFAVIDLVAAVGLWLT